MLDIFEEIAGMRARGEPGALATVISTKGSTPGKEAMRLLVRPSGAHTGTVGGGKIEADVTRAALEVIATGEPRRLTFRLTEEEAGGAGLLCGGEVEVFIESVTLPTLLLFGAGHVGLDVCDVAARAGFQVTVVDDREEFATARRFPRAHRVVALPTFEECFTALRPTPATFCVIVTRGHEMDEVCADFALHSDAPYVGLIGSKRKVRTLLTRLAAAGRLQGVDLARLHAPIGVDVGGSSAGEIAVAIVSEMVAERRGRLHALPTKRLSLDEMRSITESAPATNDDSSPPSGEQR